MAELLASGGRCRLCNEGGLDVVLTMHHRTYERLGAELPDDLTCLCGVCHDVVTGMLRHRAYAKRALPPPRDVVPVLPGRTLTDNLEDRA